jgi:UPF0755 protein
MSMRSQPPYSFSMRFSSRPDSRTIRILALAAIVACGGSSDGPPRKVIIPAGSSFRATTDSLVSAGIIASPRMFRIFATIKRSDRGVKPGTYLLRPGTSWSTVLHSLNAGTGLVRSVTIPEGFSLAAIEPLVARTLNVPAESVAAAVRDTAILRRLDIPTPTLEGYLFPDTYQFSDGATARDAVEAMIEQFEAKWDPAWDAQLEKLPMTRHAAITLASIIEKEARLPEERPIISAVYHNRLRINMPLQADPTVQYARGTHASRVTFKDLEIKSAYNTYQRPGLPPGPIASPGKPSIEAAIFPADVPFRYFVAHPDGHHEFRVTFEEHKAARDKVRRAQRVRPPVRP